MTAISQPPHSAGQRFQGLRSHIDRNVIPSPVQLAQADEQLWREQAYLTCASEHPVPMAGTSHVAIDQGNSAPRFARITTYAVPKDAELANTCAIPIAASFQPFAHQPPQEVPVPVVSGPIPRCIQCRGYISVWCAFSDGGTTWTCNLCSHANKVPDDYFPHLDPQSMRRIDQDTRPELNVGTVDIDVHDAGQDYWTTQYEPSVIEPQFVAAVSSTAQRNSIGLAGPSKPAARQPVRLRTLFAIETTAEAVEAGLVRAACDSIRAALYADQGTSIGDVGILTFDTEIAFYTLEPQRPVPQMLVVSDLDEVFCPTQQGIFVDPIESRHLIEKLLDDIPDHIFAQTTSRSSAFLPSARAALSSLASTGGHAIFFAHSLPSIGPGTLTSRLEETSIQGTPREREMFLPRDPAYTSLADECARAGVGVSLVVGCRRWIDLGTLGVLPNTTGGEIAFFPQFSAEKDGPALMTRVRRLVANVTAYDCSLRIRCSKELNLQAYTPPPGPSAPAQTLSLGILRANLSIQATFEHGGSTLRGGSTLDERQPFAVQCATLYTDARSGRRRVRICNLAVAVSGLAGNVFRAADVESVAMWLARRAVGRTSSKALKELKDELAERTASMMLAYRKNCAASVAPSQLILPDALKTLPVLALGITKTKCLKGGSVNSDVRNAHAHLVATWEPGALMRHLYPRLVPLHVTQRTDAPEDAVVVETVPRPIRAGHPWMEAEGLYVLDNGVHTVLWVGYSVDPALLQDLFGTQQVHGASNWPRDMRALPDLDNPTSRRVRTLIDTSTTGQLLIARQNEDANEMAFGDMLVEDSNNDGMSYVDYLCFLYKHISAALTGDTTIGQQMGFRAPVPW